MGLLYLFSYILRYVLNCSDNKDLFYANFFGDVFIKQGEDAGKDARVCAFQTESETLDMVGWMVHWLDGRIAEYWLPFTRHIPRTEKSLSRSKDRVVSYNSAAQNGFLFSLRESESNTQSYRSNFYTKWHKYMSFLKLTVLGKL